MESINTPKLDSHYYLFIGDILFITLHSYDAVLCLMMCLITCEASVVSVSSSLVFCGNSVQMCTSASYRITMITQILGAHIFRLFLSIS